MAKRTPKYDGTIDGVRVRIYATHTDYEAVFNDDDPDDPEANVLCYPKMGDPTEAPTVWAHQARLEYVPDSDS